MLAMFSHFSLFFLIAVSSVLASPLEDRRPRDYSLVAETSNRPYNWKVVRVDSFSRASFAGGGTIVKVFINGIRLSASSANTGNTAVINSIQGANGCSAGGELQFADNYSTNKCAKYQPFTWTSSRGKTYLAFNGSSTFYICNGIVSWNDVSLPGCSPAKLYRK